MGERGGREEGLQDWERRLGRPASSLIATDFYGEGNWSSFAAAKWKPGLWSKQNRLRKLAWSIPLTFKGTPLKDVAAGLHDSDFRVAAEAIAAAQPDAVIRIGWEMNGDWMAWAAAGVEVEYIGAYRHAVRVFRAASPRFKFDWCVNWGRNQVPPDLLYPGDDAVDVIGADVYDLPYEADVVKRWREKVLETPFGLDWLVRFSAQHDKKMSVPEWGVGLSGAADDPYFIDRMRDWFAAHADRIAYQAYFAVPPHDFESGNFPKSEARFLQAFSR